MVVQIDHNEILRIAAERELGEQLIAAARLHVRPMDEAYRKEVYGDRAVGGYTITAKRDAHSGWYVHVPLSAEAEGNSLIARMTLDNAMRSLEYIAGGGEV